MTMQFENGYFHGEGSNYEDYTKKKFDQLAVDLISILGLNPYSRVVDFGCATGGLLKALIDRGIGNVVGTDISYWAIKYGRKQYNLPSTVLQLFNRQLLEEPASFLLALDVLEHVPTEELNEILSSIKAAKMVVRIPVSDTEGGPYILEVSRNDKTHIQAHTKKWWEDLFRHWGYEPFLTLQGTAIFDSEGVLARAYARPS